MYKRKTEILRSSYIHSTISFTTSELFSLQRKFSRQRMSRDEGPSVPTDATAQAYPLRPLRGQFVRQRIVNIGLSTTKEQVHCAGREFCKLTFVDR